MAGKKGTSEKTVTGKGDGNGDPTTVQGGQDGAAEVDLTGDGAPAQVGEPGSLEEQMAMLQAQVADGQALAQQQAEMIKKLAGPKGLVSAREPHKLIVDPPTQAELAEKELRRYVKKGGVSVDPETKIKTTIPAGFRKGIDAEGMERAQKLLAFLEEETGVKRNKKAPGWDMSILDDKHVRTLV